MAQAKRDENYVPTLLAVSNADGITPVTLYADPTSHRLLVDASTQVFSVKSYGAFGDGSSNDTAAIQSAITAATAAGGGIVFFPAGTYVITSAIALASSVSLVGAGAKNSTGASTIKQTSTTADALRGTNTTVSMTNVTIQDLRIEGPGATSAHGIYLKNTGNLGTYPPFTYFYLKNVYIANFLGAGAYGFVAESLIVSTLDVVVVESCTNGFYLNGHGDGGAFSTVSTSTTFLNTYANGCTTNGYNIRENTYISFVGTACDFASGSGIGYLIDTSNSISFTGCGAELGGVFTGTLYKFSASAQCGMYNCYAFQNDNVAVQVTSTSTGISIIGFQNNSDTATSTTGLLVDAGSQVTEIDTNWGTATTLRSINSTGIDKRPEISRTSTITSSSTPTPNAGTDDNFTVTALATGTTFAAPTGTPENGQRLLIRVKDNGSARSIAWNGIYRASSDLALPTTTGTSKTIYMRFVYNSTDTKWDMLTKLDNFT